MIIRRVARTLLALAAFGLLGAAPPAKPLEYTLTPELKDGALVALDVTLKMDADASGTTKLDLPDSSGGATELWRNIGDLQIDGAKSVSEAGPAVRLVHAPAGTPLTIRYRVTSAFAKAPNSDDMNTYKPAIQPRWFWAYGEAFFIVPDSGQPPVLFHWSGDYPFAASIECADGEPISEDDLIESVLVGGPDLKIYQREAEGALRVAVVGTYPFSGDTFADMATRIIRAERIFWRAKNEKPFLAALAPVAGVPGYLSMRGEGRRDAFAIMTNPEMPQHEIQHVLAHEYFHTWNPARLGGMHDGDQERADYWFSEGFTDYYARTLLLRSGEYSPKAFAADWNDMLLAYANSPVRTAPNTEIVASFRKENSLAASLPYQRGAILAATWNRQFLEKSKGRVSLDDVIRAMPPAAIAHPDMKAPQLFEMVARRYGLDVSAQTKSVVDEGAPALLPANAFAPCFDVHTSVIPAYDVGFDSDATRKSSDQTVVGVNPDSNAYKAGLRNGMTFVRAEAGKHGDSREDVVIQVRDQGVEHTITYRPEGRATTTLQEVVPSSNTGCRAAQSPAE